MFAVGFQNEPVCQQLWLEYLQKSVDSYFGVDTLIFDAQLLEEMLKDLQSRFERYICIMTKWHILTSKRSIFQYFVWQVQLEWIWR